MAHTAESKHRYGMVIDLDRCSGCGACMVACAVENNVPPAQAGTNERTGLTWMRVNRMENGASFPDARSVFVPVMCQQCGHETPCVAVCPQNAVDVDPVSGVVGQMAERCLGCRYCMTACPYHARYFNWRDPVWPAGMERTLNPDVAPRMRGVVEKCNFCHGRLHAARAKAAASGLKKIAPEDYVPACAEACPAQAIVFGDLKDPHSEVARLAGSADTFRLLEKLGTEPKVHYHSREAWVREMAKGASPATKKENRNG
jgi:menaquinone reductase, iron-sulfur cluster-binding subunit